MSTLTAWAKGPRALIVNDTAGVDLLGVIRGWVSKIITVPHLRMVVTTRGAIAALPHLATDLVAEFASFDDIVEHGPEFLARAHDSLMMRLADQSGCGEFDLAIVGWSTSRRRCEAYAISTLDYPGLPAFTFLRNDVWMAPIVPAAEVEAAGLMVQGVIPGNNPEALVLGMIELQRRQRVPLGGIEGMPEHFIVGGQAVLTEITENGIAQRIARTWPDRIGERITPEPAAARPAASIAMSRQQRRAAEAQARKVPAHAS